MTLEEEQGKSDPLVALSGTALRVYLYMLKRGEPVTPREIQKAMGFRSISTAYHHLERLASMGLVEKRGEGYVARRPRGLLGLYLRLHGRLIPRLLVAAAAVTGAAVGYTLAQRDPLATILLWLASLLMWIEALTLWKALESLAEKSE